MKSILFHSSLKEDSFGDKFNDDEGVVIPDKVIMLSLSLVLQGLSIVAVLNALAVIVYDMREKMIPLPLIVLFISLSFITACLTRVDLEKLTMVVLIGFLGLFYLAFKKMVGLADCFLLPGCFAWIKLDEIPLFLILCGLFSIAVAIFWRIKYHEMQYPFAPAILFALSVVLLF